MRRLGRAPTTNVLDDLGERAEARRLKERALAIREEAMGPEHPEVATSLNSLAMLLDDLGERTEARRLLERAVAIGEKALEPGHPATQEYASNLQHILRNDDEG